METISINKRKLQIGGKAKGAFTNKYNRACKLAARFDELDKKFRGMAERGNCESDTARHALACLLMLHTGIRVGNESSAEGYVTKPHPNQKDKQPEFVQTYGLTTLQKRHIAIYDKYIAIDFVGKKQVDNAFVLTDAKIAKYFRLYSIKTLHNNEDLFFNLSVYSLTKFIKKHIGSQFTPKDLRCMRANLYAAELFKDLIKIDFQTKKAVKESVKSIYTHVAEKLNNTPSVCKKSYISPEYEYQLLTKYIS